MGGTDARSIAGYVDGEHRIVRVRGAAPLALEQLLYGSGSPGVSLFRTTGASCFTVAGLKEHVARVLAEARLPIRFRVTSLGPDMGLSGARGRRYREGCAVSAGPYPEFEGGRTVIVGDLLQRDAPAG
jgi:hypothetical protein